MVLYTFFLIKIFFIVFIFPYSAQSCPTIDPLVDMVDNRKNSKKCNKKWSFNNYEYATIKIIATAIVPH